ncbi:hypothetical protein ACMXY9_03965 [Pasteurella multocida]|uniref:hypothetical protein n=1 Tax=Pasteurella multocida TaxID=747 RepID=UPI003CF3C2B9
MLGFNFRKAIGEPLTILLEKMILSKLPIDPTVQAEFQLELLKVAKDPAARKTLEKWK